MAKTSKRKSIFELERRIDMVDELDKLITIIDEMTVSTMNGNHPRFAYYLDKCLQAWPYRNAALDVEGYLAMIGIDLDNYSEEDVPYIYELYVNLLHWAPEYDKNHDGLLGGWNDGETVSEECNRLLENIDYILEKCNLAVREKKIKGSFSQYRIYKRKAELDATLTAVPELAEVLLSYWDIRNAKDETAKKEILRTIADYMEPLRAEYKQLDSGLCDDIFFVFNKCNIRHNDKKQLSMTKAKRMELYDQTFNMCLHLMQKKDVLDYKNRISELKTQPIQK